MKKILLIIISILTVFTITGCTNKTSEPQEEIEPAKITMEIKEDSVSSSKATIIITNNTKFLFNYGLEFSMEKYTDELWVEIPMKEEISYITEVYSIDAESKKEETIEWKKEYGKLEKGKYRLVKNFINPDERVTAKVEFEIK